MNLLKAIFTFKRKPKPVVEENSTQRLSVVAKVRDIHPEVRQRLSQSIQSYRQEFLVLGSDYENPAPSFFSVFTALKAKWEAVNVFFCETQPHLQVAMNCPCEAMLEERIDLLKACYLALKTSEVPYIYVPFNLVQMLLQTFQDVVLAASNSASVSAAQHLVELLGLLHWCVIEDQSTLLLCEDFIQTFVQCFNCILKLAQHCQPSDFGSFRRAVFSFLQTNYALGELYAAHVDIEHYRWLNNFLRYILEVFRGVFALAAGPQDFFYDITLHSYTDLLPDTLAQCLVVSVAQGLPVLDFFSLTLCQLRKLSTRLTDDVDISILKSTIFELALPLLLSLHAHYTDLSLKPALIYKSVQVAEFLKHLSAQSDDTSNALNSWLKELFCETVLAYTHIGSATAKPSFMEDRQTDISCFFRYILELDLKLYAATEAEGSLMAKFEVLSVPEVIQMSQYFPPLVQAYSLEYIDHYLDHCVKHLRSFASLVASGICETVFESFLFDLPDSPDLPERYTEFRRAAAMRSHSILEKLLLSSSSSLQTLSSFRLGLARNWHKFSYQARAYDLIVFLTGHKDKASEFLAILLEDHLLTFYLQLLDDHVLVESGEMEMEVVCLVLQVVSHFIGFQAFAKELEQARGLFCKMCGSISYYQQASSHLFLAFKHLEVDTPLFTDLISTIGRLDNSTHIKALIDSIEQTVVLLPLSWHKTKIQVRLLAEYPNPILTKAAELQELSIITKVLQLFHIIRTGLDRDKETLILVSTANTIVHMIRTSPYQLPELTACVTELFSLMFMPARGDLLDCEYPQMLPALLHILIACTDDQQVAEYLRSFREQLQASFYSISSFSRYVEPATLLNLFNRPALVEETTKLMAVTLKYYCKPQMFKAMLQQINRSLHEENYADTKAMVKCIKQSASQGNCTYKLQKSLIHLHWQRAPAYSLHFSSHESSLNVKCQGKLFDDSSCILQFWLFPQAPGELLSLHFGKDRSLKIDLRGEGELRLLFTRTRGTSELSQAGVVFWQNWNLVTMKLAKNLAKLIVNTTSYETTLLEFVPSEEYNEVPPVVVLGFSEEASFVGEITHLVLCPGGQEDQVFLDLYSIGFTNPMDLASEEVLNFHSTDEKNEDFGPLVELFRSKAILYLTCQGTEVPLAMSPAAYKAKQKEVRGYSAETLSLESKKVYVCSGTTLLQAVHSAGGIKMIIPLIGKVLRQVPDSTGPVTDLLTLLYSLLMTKNTLTMLEVAKDSLLDMLGAQLQTLEQHGLLTPRMLRICEKLATVPWLFYLPKAISGLLGEEEWAHYLENPPSLRLMTDYRTWRSLDQNLFYQVVQQFAERRLFNGALMYPLRIQIFNYYLKLARAQEQAFLGLSSDSFKASLVLYLKVSDFDNFLTLELQRPKANSIAALLFLMQLLNDRNSDSFQEFVEMKASKVAKFVDRLSALADFCREGLPHERYQSCVHLISWVLTTLMEIKVRHKSQERTVLEELKDTVFKVAMLCSRSEMNRLLFHFYRKYKVEVPLQADYLRYFEILFREDLVSYPNDRETSFFATEILADLLRAPPSSQHFAKYYEAILGFSFRRLMTQAIHEVFVLYLHAIIGMLLKLKLNEHLVVFLLYFIEDLHRNFQFQIELSMVETLLDQVKELGIHFERSPFMPEFTDWNTLTSPPPATSMTSFYLREGGIVRVTTNLLLRLLSQQAGKAAELMDLLSKYLRLKKLSDPYLFSVFQGLNPIKGALFLQFPHLEKDGDLFGNELGIWAFVFGELCELLLAQPQLRETSVVSEVVVELMIARDSQKRNIVDLYLSRAISHEYTAWLRTVYFRLTSVHAADVYPRKRFVEYCLESFAMADADYQRIELEGFLKLETQLKAIKRDRNYDQLYTILEDRSSDLARLHDFCLAYTSMKLKLVEDLLPEVSFVNAQPSSPVVGRDRRKKSGINVYFSEIIRTNRNYRLLGRRKLQVLTRAASRKGEVWGNNSEASFWRLSSPTDSLGRRTRLTPLKNGSGYQENINRKYKQIKTDLQRDTEEEAKTLSEDSQTPPRSPIEATPPPLVKAPTEPSKCIGELLYFEEYSFTAGRRKHCLLYNSERVQMSGVTFGRLEFYWDSIIFRSKGDRRPKLPRYELGSLDIFHRPKESLLVFSLSEVDEVVWKRFMHTRSALEFYMKNGRSYLFNIFEGVEYHHLRTFFKTEAESLIPFNECSPEQTAATSKKWRSGGLSNFEYLMQLNKYASRSYNDLNQYPVFPWILSNYTRQDTEWEDSDFRDLSKPIGALDDDSREKAIARYRQLEQVEGIMPYNYGTHYTSGGVVLYYLLRMEPYTYQAILLHDNKFDIADRIFSSIQRAWECTLNNYADNKELLPEFFYLPEGFLNLHNYNLGWKQSGPHVKVNDVEMPTWACHPAWPQMNAYRYVYYNRRALEHSWVSARLHRWIDLIFGSKQMSKDDVNVYPALSYEANFALKLVECEAEGLPKVTLLTEVAHYGQTPVQLFDRPHEKRGQGDKQGDKRKKSLFTDFSWTSLYVAEPLPDTDVKKTRKSYRRFEQADILHVQQTAGLSLVVYLYEGSICLHLFDANKGSMLKSLMSMQARDTCPIEDVSPVPNKATAATLLSSDWLVTGLHHDNSFRLYKASIKPLKLVLRQTVRYHNDVVCCVHGLGDDILVTGSRDGALVLWEACLPTVRFRAALRGHDSEILKIEANAELVLVGSISKRGSILLHDLRSGELFNLITPQHSHVNTFALSSQGFVAVSVGYLVPHIVLYSINGELGRGPLREIDFVQQDWYSAMKASEDIGQDYVFQLQFNRDGDHLISASLSFFAILSVYEPDRMPFLYPARQRITAFSVDPEEIRILLHIHRIHFLRLTKL